MDIRQLLTPKILGLSGAGVVAVSGTAISLNSSGSKGESSSPHESERTFTFRNDISHPNPDVSKDFLHGQKQLNNYACSKKVFSENLVINRISSSNGSSGGTSTPASPSTSSSSVLGCSLASLSHIPENDGSDAKFTFDTELAFRNDEYGWVIWSEGKYSKDKKSENVNATSYTPTNNLVYHVVFLKKNGDSWKVEGGYGWYDKKFYETSKQEGSFVDKFHFVVPEGQDWIQGLKTKVKGTKQYLGIWTQDVSSDQGLLQGLKIWSGSDEKPEILGRGGDVDFTSDAETYGYSKSLETYVADSGGNTGNFRMSPKSAANDLSTTSTTDTTEIMTYYNKQDIKETLKNWYDPFKDKKGKWKTLDDYCKDSPQTEGLKGLCPTTQ